jgi:protein-tyrosine phosphatase
MTAGAVVGRYDLHTHLLPGIDDGAPDMATGLEMARLAAADGTAVIVATPHQKDVMENASIEALRALFDRFNRELAASSPVGQGVPVRVVLGMENHIEPELPDWVKKGTALPLNGTKFILCEPPFEAYPLYLDDTLFRVQQQGLVPVIAHPERCLPFQRQPEKLAALVDRGMLVQVTASSLLGEFERPARKAVETFLSRGLVHMVASDMHRAAATRLPFLARAQDRVAELVGEEQARRLFVDTPRAIVEGGNPDIDPLESRRGKRRWWPLR